MINLAILALKIRSCGAHARLSLPRRGGALRVNRIHRIRSTFWTAVALLPTLPTALEGPNGVAPN